MFMNRGLCRKSNKRGNTVQPAISLMLPFDPFLPNVGTGNKKRILLLSERFGTGHTQAAHALAISLRRLSPHVQTRVMELGSFLNPKTAPLIIQAYRKAILAQPKLVGFMYRAQYKKSLKRITTMALHRIFYTHAMSVMRQLKPDMIVCTHPIPSAVTSRLRRLGLDVPLYTVITDYDAHAAWVSPEVNRYLVSTSEVKKKLGSHGVSNDSIQVTGIPVHPNFWGSHNVRGKSTIRTQFGLKDMPTILVMGGGWGLMDSTQLTEMLTHWRKDIQLIFCIGDNEKLRRRMLENPRFQHENVHLMGYTRKIAQLMDISDLLITKPGGMTCTEAMAKGIPMLFYHPLPGQEEENCNYFIEKGYGESIESEHTIKKWADLLVHHYDEVSARRSQHEHNYSQYYPKGCAEAILHMLNEPYTTTK